MIPIAAYVDHETLEKFRTLCQKRQVKFSELVRELITEEVNLAEAEGELGG